ncbi:MAG TPA: hypothetical protein IAC41_09800 [Candidatus Merdenecus merdavium]|nr:hypothetical protein [Candidatus Merdenecus merdavium]
MQRLGERIDEEESHAVKRMKEIIETLSAAKAPKKDGKGNSLSLSMKSSKEVVIVRQSDVEWCGRSIIKLINYLLPVY